MDQKYHVMLALPNAGSFMPCCVSAVFVATRSHRLALVPHQFNQLPHNFNVCWCNALAQQEVMGLTHLAMLHHDIRMSELWLDVLLSEQDRTNSDVMASVVAIKDTRGLTTTGLRRPGLWGTRRFTMTEIMKLPETFDIHDVWEAGLAEHDDEYLAINTGAWVCRFPANGWPAEFPAFESHTRIRTREGQRVPEFDSEDWLFSDWLNMRELKVCATRKVGTWHQGVAEFGNQEAHGSLQTDSHRPTLLSMDAEKEEQAVIEDAIDELEAVRYES